MLFFFFKQKTAYEMRIIDWSSDVCSSDLDAHEPRLRSGEESARTQNGRGFDPRPLRGGSRTRSLPVDAARADPQDYPVRQLCARRLGLRAAHDQGIPLRLRPASRARTSGGSGKRVSVRVEPGGRRTIKKKKK